VFTRAQANDNDDIAFNGAAKFQPLYGIEMGVRHQPKSLFGFRRNERSHSPKYTAWELTRQAMNNDREARRTALYGTAKAEKGETPGWHSFVLLAALAGLLAGAFLGWQATINSPCMVDIRDVRVEHETNGATILVAFDSDWHRITDRIESCAQAS
jgi:hypothetical protein